MTEPNVEVADTTEQDEVAAIAKENAAKWQQLRQHVSDPGERQRQFDEWVAKRDAQRLAKRGALAGRVPDQTTEQVKETPLPNPE